MATTPQPSQVCPLCQSNNLCTGNDQCWCFSTAISASALSAVPEALKNKQCICPDCAAKYAHSLATDAGKQEKL